MTDDITKTFNCIAFLLGPVVLVIWFLAARAVFQIRTDVAQLVWYEREKAKRGRAAKLMSQGAPEADAWSIVAREFPE